MIPNQQYPHDYGFNLSKKYALPISSPQSTFSSSYQYQNVNNGFFHQNIQPKHELELNKFNNRQNQFKRQLIIDDSYSKDRTSLIFKDNNDRDRAYIGSNSYKNLNKVSQKRQNLSCQKNIIKELNTAQSFPSTQNLLPLNPSLRMQVFQDFLYKLVGIGSCHVRVQQRSALQQLKQYVKFIKSIRNCTGFCTSVNKVVKNKLLSAFSALKLSTIAQSPIKSWKNGEQHSTQHKSKIDKKITKIDTLRDSRFNLQQSAVEKGLKYLEQRANERKRKQQQRTRSRNKKIRYGLDLEMDSGSQIVTGKFITTEGSMEYNPFEDNQNKKTKTSQFKSSLNKEDHTMKNKIQNKQKPKQNPNNVFQTSNKVNLVPQQIKNENIKPASWLTTDIKQNPYIPVNRYSNFERYETNQRKYHLNPDTFKDAEPDHHEFLMPTQNSKGQFQSPDQYGIQKKFISKNMEVNLLQDTIPMFDPNINYNQRNAKLINIPQLNMQTTKKSVKNSFVNPYIKNVDPLQKQEVTQQQKIIDGPPSFNQKGKFIQQHTATFQEDEKQRRKSDLAGYRFKTEQLNKNKGSQIRISDQGQDVCDELEEQTPRQFRKRNKIMQYYTEKNIASKNIRASNDFQNNRHKRPNSRPKSMTYSIGNQSTKQITMRPTNINKLQSKKLINNIFNPNPSQQNLINNVNTNSLGSPQNIQIHSPQIMQHNIQNISSPKPRVSFFQNIQQPNRPQDEIYNKPARAVSSGCKFFYAEPKQFQNMYPHATQVSPQVQTNIFKGLNLNQNPNIQERQQINPNSPRMTPQYNHPAPVHNSYGIQISKYFAPQPNNYQNQNAINLQQNVKQINIYSPMSSPNKFPQQNSNRNQFAPMYQSQQQQAYNLIAKNRPQPKKGINVYVSQDDTLARHRSQKKLY